MPHRPRALAFDLSAASLVSLQDALPEWEIVVVGGATAATLPYERDLGAADLLVVMASQDDAKTLGLCRGLKSQRGWAHTPLLVLVRPADEALVTAALKAGADSCLILPFHAKELASMLARAQEGNQPGRHTLSLDHAQREDLLRDEGGEA